MNKIIPIMLIGILILSGIGVNSFSMENNEQGVESNFVSVQNNGINVLLLVPNYFGALCHRVIDTFNDYGWNITLVGVTETISACNGSVRYWNIPPLKMDYLVSEISDVSNYDALCIMHPSKWENYPEYGDPAGDLIRSPEALNLVSSAAENGITIAAWCAGVRVLAAADVISGKRVTGPSEYIDEYTAAGAIYVSQNSYPVVDGNIITVSGMRYILDMCEEIAILIEDDIHMESVDMNCLQFNNIRSNQTQSITSWNRTFGGICADGGRSIDNTDDGGFIITGYTFSFGAGNSDVYLIKTDESGNVLWQKSFGGMNSDCGNSVCQTTDGGYVITGFTNNNFSSTNKDVFLIRTDADGNIQWTKTFGGALDDEGNSVCETNDNGFIITGYSKNESNDAKEIYLIKTDVNGDSQWIKTFKISGSMTNRGNSVCQNMDGGFLVAGSTGSYSNGCLIKTDSDGNVIWRRETVVDNIEYSWGSSACQLSDGSFVFMGHGRIGISDILDVFIEKRSPFGDLLWSHSLGERPSFDYGNSMSKTLSNSVIICGTTRSSVTDNDLFIYEIDTSNGNIIRKELVSLWGIDCGKSVCISSDGCVVIVGYTNSFGNGNFDVLLLKIPWIDSQPPDKPQIPSGPSSGKIGNEYSYSSVSFDPDGDDLFYLFDWGDGTDSGWIGPFISGGECIASHTWDEQGGYEIKVKAKDIYGRESEWSDPLSITMPKNKQCINVLILNFLENHPIIYRLIQRFLKL